MLTAPCRHFQLEIEEIYVANTGVQMRIPIRRCLLAEQMVGLMMQMEEGRDTARRLMLKDAAALSASESGEGGEAAIALIRVAFGPDLEAIHSVECTVERCLQSCSPSYKETLLYFGMVQEAEQETGDGCLELLPEPSG